MLQMYSDIHYKLTFSISDKEKKKQKYLSDLIEIVLFAPWWLIQLPPKRYCFHTESYLVQSRVKLLRYQSSLVFSKLVFE